MQENKRKYSDQSRFNIVPNNSQVESISNISEVNQINNNFLAY
jgi:hypothetical protein